ncbi:MAG: hypothetical protein RLZZ253_2076, partial [Verrucomicrobiota bacterium]
ARATVHPPSGSRECGDADPSNAYAHGETLPGVELGRGEEEGNQGQRGEDGRIHGAAFWR